MTQDQRRCGPLDDDDRVELERRRIQVRRVIGLCETLDRDPSGVGPGIAAQIRLRLEERKAEPPAIEALPALVRCGSDGCCSAIASDVLPGAWVMIDGIWQCPTCQHRKATSC